MQKMRCRGEAWFVLQREQFDQCSLVTLRGADEGNLGETARVLAPFDRIVPLAGRTGLRRAARSRVLRRAAHAIASARGWNEAWTAATAAIDLLAWQLEPALAAVSGATRLLLADEVGLGKTIQAGLVLTELRARGLISRALVLTPASLRDQWASELRDRFGLEPLVVDHAALARLASELPVGVNPWGSADLIISSIDLVKRPEVRTAVDTVPFDVLVVDEAHHLKPGTDRGAVVADLATRVPWVAFATATPHSGDDHAYAFLRGLGAIGAADDLRVYRRSARQVGQPRRRCQRFCPITATDAERAVLDQTLAYARAVWRRQTQGEPGHAALIASVLCRRAVSSVRALLRTLERRRALLMGITPLASSQPLLPWHEGDDADDVEPDSVLASAGLPDPQREVEWLEQLVVLARAAAARSSKAAVIERLVTRTREPLLVFSEYRHTVEDLSARLDGRATVAVLHGAMSADERRDAVHRFVSGRARVLLATDAAGEGLNLQARCRLVVNVELPWSPLRLEQRIGRVDRLGQTRRVHALNLFHRGSFEDEVLARLQRRMHKAARELADIRVDDRAIAARIFDGEPLVETVTPDGTTSGNISLHQGFGGQAAHCALTASPALRRRALELSRLRSPASATRATARQARLRAERTGLQGRAICAEPPRRHRLVERFVLLFECDVHDGRGRLVAREVLPIAVHVKPALAVRRGSLRRRLRAAAASAIVQTALVDEVTRRTSATATATRRTGAALEQRLRALLAHAGPPRPALFQASLFDRRAEQRARANDAAMAIWRGHLEHRLDDVGRLSHLEEASEPRLIAAWPVAE